MMTPLADKFSRIVFFGGLGYVIGRICKNKQLLRSRQLLQQQMKAELDERNQYLHDKSGGIVADILLAILLWEKHLHLRRTRERNQIAARQIEELLAQKEELRKAYRRQPLHPEDAPNEEPPAAQANTSPSAADDEDNRRRFMQMEDALLTDLPFLNPDFNREDLMKITALSKNRLNPFLREYAGADGFSDYINRLRVEHSISMLKDNRMYSIDAIATASGFKSRNTYYVAFNKLLGMTPVQYRETLPDKSAEPCTEPIV